MNPRFIFVFLAAFAAAPAFAQDACPAVTAALGAAVRNVQCTASSDLTTNNPNTTPPNAPGNAFTPRTDAEAVSPDAPHRTPITRAVPGLQITGVMADDADARWVLRLPEDWNGKLVVGVPGGTRSEFMGDYIFSDFVVQRGYAYASTNKGTLNFFFTGPPAADPLGCRLTHPSHPFAGFRVHFYLAEEKDTIPEWFRRTREVTALAKAAVS